ncbi:ATP-binding protein [Streptomyces lavendulae]|uniref:ATP-binding protein n=1 Tax=Streptomyces lavendulae TaxID=1914 RepID=UPI0036EA94CA
MTIERLTAEDLDHLQRTGFEPPRLGPESHLTQAPLGLRTLVRVAGIGRLEKTQHTPFGGTNGTHCNGDPQPSRDLLVTLYNYQVPLAFMVSSEPGQAAFRAGTWLPEGSYSSAAQANERLLESALRALYPTVDIRPDDPVTGTWQMGGLVLGIPTPTPPDSAEGVRQFDRLLRALHQVRWAALILAQPLGETLVRDLKLRLINEMRSVQTAVTAGGVPSPLADHYLELLGVQLKAFTDGQGTGAWRTAAYLLGDADGYPQVASLWRGIFSGDDSLPEPVRVSDRDDVPKLANSWAMPDPAADTSAQGHYIQPFQHQTLLTSTQLAAYVHFPNVETNGFVISQVPQFDTVPPAADSAALNLGSVVERQQITRTSYGIHPDKLTRHTFVTGVTGSGKTNTVFYLLRQAAERSVPFLVLEPAKTEYRVLLRDHVLGPQLQLFTLGDENVSPFRLNPFEVPEGIPVAVHLDLLRSVFNASFGMWTPLPQILEVSLHAIYADRGWDVTTDTNRRLDEATDRSVAFPTLTDLVRKVEELVPQLGYEDKVTGDLRAALSTRLNSLRTGGKGRMLDVRRSSPFELLLGHPAVLELEGMGDDDDKAFMMGLLMIRLAEHRRCQGDTNGLQHLLVIEEAHRLLANTAGPRSSGEVVEANVRGKAVDTFTSLLSEIRAYGQGVIVVDQIPAKLAPDVLKNTNLKIAHRIVAGDDREVLGATMVMTPGQDVALATLPVGRAAVFTDGDDAPLLLQVPPSKGGSGTWPTPGEVREHMASRRPDAGGMTFSTDCDQRCLAAPGACEVAGALVENRAVMRSFARVVLSAVYSAGGMERCWQDVTATVEPHRPRWVESKALLACLVRHGACRLADARGARAGWTYAQTLTVADLIDKALVAHIEGHATTDDVTALRRQLLALQGDGYGPFLGCARIWEGRPGPCLCASPVAELVEAGGFAKAWAKARDTDRASLDAGRRSLWNVCQDAAYQLVEYPAEGQAPDLVARLKGVANCTALCFAQQMLAAEEWAHPATERRALTELLVEAGRQVAGMGAEEVP